MTFLELKDLVAVFLTSDNILAIGNDTVLTGDEKFYADNAKALAALKSTYIEISNKTTAMRLLTANTSDDLIRQSQGGMYIRMPKMPTSDSSILDIDDELGPVVARIIASYISREKGGIHRSEAYNMIRDYEAKVENFINSQREAGAYDDETDTFKYTDR